MRSRSRFLRSFALIAVPAGLVSWLVPVWLIAQAKDVGPPARAMTVKHWAYVRPLLPALPPVKDKAWCRNPIDSFVLARLQKEGMHPSIEADRATLIRRVNLDLIGLPPTVEEAMDFVNDSSPNAYEKVVDRLLANPHYGERQAIRWLDLARYADSNGYEKDRLRSMWPYRDWVINAFNADMPFDQFTIEQIAGDLLPNATLEQKIATGFNRNTMLNEEGGVDPEEYRYYVLVDRVNTTATVWLGTSLGCCQCHNHKFDPLTQVDYYRFLAYFNSTAEETSKRGGTDPVDISPRVTVDTPQLAAIRKRVSELRQTLDRPTPKLEQAQVQWEQSERTAAWTVLDIIRSAPRPAGVPGRIAAILAISADQRDEKQKRELAAYYRSIAPALEPVRQQVALIRTRIDAYPKTSLVMQELPHPRATHVHTRGGFLTPAEQVTPGTPAVLSTSNDSPSDENRFPTRLDLAKWLVSIDNPLTARVTVNRVWEECFGRGIVATSEDFGTQGERPVNQQLLDFLACQFMNPSTGARPWRIKSIIRLIVTSATYRQSSNVTPQLLEKDPYNRLLARGPRFRLPAELIRDQALAASGLLSEKMGGPSVFPIQPEGIWHSPYSSEKWPTSNGGDRYRRGIYTFHRRSAPYPAFMAFDKTTQEAVCTRRSRTDTPLQALTTLNDPAFIQPAAALARRIMQQGGDGTQNRADLAFRAVLVRSPDPIERDRMVALHDQMLRKYEAKPKEAEKLAISGLSVPPKELSIPDLAAWTVVSNVLLNLDETLTKP